MESFQGKIPQNYKSIRNETCIYEQKPIKHDVFNEVEEKEVKEHVQKEEKKEGKLPKTISFQKRKKKIENNKEKEMLKRLGELNQELTKIRIKRKIFFKNNT